MIGANNYKKNEKNYSSLFNDFLNLIVLNPKNNKYIRKKHGNLYNTKRLNKQIVSNFK